MWMIFVVFMGLSRAEAAEDCRISVHFPGSAGISESTRLDLARMDYAYSAAPAPLSLEITSEQKRETARLGGQYVIVSRTRYSASVGIGSSRRIDLGELFPEKGAPIDLVKLSEDAVDRLPNCRDLYALANSDRSGVVTEFEDLVEDLRYRLTTEWDGHDQKCLETRKDEFRVRVNALFAEGLTFGRALAALEETARDPNTVRDLRLLEAYGKGHDLSRAEALTIVLKYSLPL